MSTYSAGLSKAYAVLQQLERLREQDITHPIVPYGPPIRAGAEVHALAAPQQQEAHRHGERSWSRKGMPVGGPRMERRRGASPSSSSGPSTPSQTQPASATTDLSDASSSPASSTSTPPSPNRRVAVAAQQHRRRERVEPVVAYVEKLPEDPEVGPDAPPNDSRPPRRPVERKHAVRSHGGQDSREPITSSTPDAIRDPEVSAADGGNASTRTATRPSPFPFSAAAASPLPRSRPTVFAGSRDDAPSPKARFPHRQQFMQQQRTVDSSTLHDKGDEAGEEEEEYFFDSDVAREVAVAAASGAMRQLSLPYREGEGSQAPRGSHFTPSRPVAPSSANTSLVSPGAAEVVSFIASDGKAESEGGSDGDGTGSSSSAPRLTAGSSPATTSREAALASRDREDGGVGRAAARQFRALTSGPARQPVLYDNLTTHTQYPPTTAQAQQQSIVSSTDFSVEEETMTSSLLDHYRAADVSTASSAAPLAERQSARPAARSDRGRRWQEDANGPAREGSQGRSMEEERSADGGRAAEPSAIDGTPSRPPRTGSVGDAPPPAARSPVRADKQPLLRLSVPPRVTAIHQLGPVEGADAAPPRQPSSPRHRSGVRGEGGEGGRGAGRGRRRSSPPPPVLPPTVHVPLLAYVEELHAASAATLQKELTAMRASCNRPAAAECFTDCLALTVLVNERGVLRCVVVPMLVETLLRCPNTPTGDETAAAALCALAGLGDAAAEVLPVLVEMLEKERRNRRLVALAIRCVGGLAGLRALQLLAASPGADVAVRCAALDGLGMMPRSVLGHTTVLCLCSEEAAVEGEGVAPPRVIALKSEDRQERSSSRREAGGKPTSRQVAESRGMAMPLSFYAEPTPHGPYVEVASEAAGGGGSGITVWRRCSTTGAPPPPSATSAAARVAAPPPYTPTHILLDSAVARERVEAYVSSKDRVRPRREYPNLTLVMRDFFLYFVEQETRHFPATFVQAQQEAEQQLGEFLQTVEHALADPTSVLTPFLLLPFSFEGSLAQDPDVIFRLERCLLDALLNCPEPAIKEQALLTMASLPATARPHVGQPVLDFAHAYQRRFETRWEAPTPPSSPPRDGVSGSGGEPTLSAQEASEEAVLVASAVAVGYTSAGAQDSGYAGMALEQQARAFLMRQLDSSRRAVRHGACVGLGALAAASVLRPPRGDSNAADAVANVPLSAPNDALPFDMCRGRKSSVPSGRRQSTGEGEDGFGKRAVAAGGSAPAVVDALVAGLQHGRLGPEAAAWALRWQGPAAGVRALLSLLKDPRLSPAAHIAVAEALGKVNPRGGASSTFRGGADGGGDLLDDVLVGLTRAVISPSALSEEAVLACVDALAEVVDRSDPARDEDADSVAPATTDPGLHRQPQRPLHQRSTGLRVGLDGSAVDPQVDEAAFYYESREPRDCFLVLRSIIEAAPYPFAVLQALFYNMCRYGGCYGELYASQTVVESAEVAARAAAAYGLRACGPKVARTIALAMSDDAAAVRAEGFATLEAIGIDGIVALVRSPRRPAAHRQQILAALRDCLLRDLGRGVQRAAAQELYDRLVQENTQVVVR